MACSNTKQTAEKKIQWHDIQGKVRPTRGRLAILMDEKAEMTHTGIHLGDTTKIKVETARVIDVGGEPAEADHMVMSDFTPGMRLHVNKYAGNEIPIIIDGQRVTPITIDYRDALAIIPENVTVDGVKHDS